MSSESQWGYPRMPDWVRWVRRMMAQIFVLCVQDDSHLNFNNLDQCAGLGEIGANQTGAKIGGYLGRNNDPHPGHQLLCQGYREFQFMCLGFALLEDE